MKTLSFIIVVSSILIISNSCNNDDELSSSVTSDKTALKLHFKNGYNSAEGWAILHSLDGTQTLETKSFFGDADITLKSTEETKVTFSYIITRTFGVTKTYDIRSDFYAPKGDWTFDRQNYGNKGTINVKVMYPESDYNYCFLGTSDQFHWRTLGNTTSYTEFNYNMYYLNLDNTISLYSSVYNFDTNLGYCGWKLEQPFNIGDTNQYFLNLSSTLLSNNISTNRLINEIRIYALIGNNLDVMGLFYNSFQNSVNDAKIFIPASFPAVKYISSCRYEDPTSISFYQKIDAEGIANYINIPNSTISATYNSITNSYENIVTNGNFDEIYTSWSYYDNINHIQVYWTTYAPKTVTSIQRPNLPAEIIAQLTDFNIADLNVDGIGLIDYDTAESMDDIIVMFFQSSENRYNVYNEYYTYLHK